MQGWGRDGVLKIQYLFPLWSKIFRLYLAVQSCDHPGTKIRYWSNAHFGAGNDIDFSVQDTVELCMERCLANSGCVNFSYDPQNRNVHLEGYGYANCWLKSKAENYDMSSAGLTSGIRCSYEPPANIPTEPIGYYPGKILYFAADIIFWRNKNDKYTINWLSVFYCLDGMIWYDSDPYPAL